ncbi:MAG: hypothetical protein COS08_01875 [Euryarchaeota archaeon CG01_land_8_20_14_3_00_38_12]|nr:MAG: hypothetical protein COS08_01875 [Euryarchaeota archaeon CG01_land_8_20_14_3_00_38_12]PJB20884.1 MAG: hypothetical protein CO114_08315 [Euryarchaeota archaeon CG_4_9_14_3_um_filter_38_12]
MAEVLDVDLKHIHKDIMALQEELSTIKYVLFEEGELTDEAKNRLVKARNTPDSGYIDLD